MPSLYLTDIMLVVGGGLLILICLVIWAIFIRKPKGDEVTRSYVGSRSSSQRGEDEEDDDGGSGRRRKRRKRRRREHRSMNPTLSQTGGLPPVRKPGQVNPGADL